MKNLTKAKMVFILPAILAGIVVFTFIFGEIVRQLWNWLAPTLFGWPAITFWQALGLLVLCRLLVGGFGHGGSHSRGVSHRVGEKVGDRVADRIVDRVAERLESMTPEEKERFRQRIRERWGFDPSTSEGTPR